MKQKLKIVVIGGTGLIGSKLVNRLRHLEHDAVAASPRTGINAVTGEGLSAALVGADVVVDVSNSPSFEDQAVLEFFELSTRNLLAAGAVAGVKHHVALSVVGTDRILNSGYFRAKMAQEELIKAAAIPYTILRATQFFEFLGAIAQVSTQGDKVHLSPTLMQPLAADDVAQAALEVTLGEPVNGIVEVAGPEVFALDNIVKRLFEATHDPRQVVTEAGNSYFGVELSDKKALTPGDNPQIGTIHFEDWLKPDGA